MEVPHSGLFGTGSDREREGDHSYSKCGVLHAGFHRDSFDNFDFSKFTVHLFFLVALKEAGGNHDSKDCAKPLEENRYEPNGPR